MLARFLLYCTTSRRLLKGWHGQSEPGVQGDLLVLLSQDRWVRIQGPGDDLKAVTSGAWMRDASTIEGWMEAWAKVCVYASVA